MDTSDTNTGDAPPSLSRRQLLVASAAGAAATGIEGADLATASEIEPQLSWERELDVPLTPAAHVVDGTGTAVVTTNPLQVDEHSAIGFDMQSGERLWSTGIDVSPTLWSDDGTLYHQESRTLTAIDPRTGEERWTAKSAFETPFYRAGGYALFGGGTDQPTVIDLTSGTIPWRFEGLTFNDAVGMDAERVVCYGDGVLAAFGVAEGEERWRVEGLPEGRFTVEAFSDWPYGFVVDAEAERTIAFDLREGEERWSIERAVVPRRVETESAGEVVVFVDDGHVERLDPSTGGRVWEQTLPNETALLAEVNLGLAVVFAEEQFWALSLQDGSIVRAESLDGPVRGVDGYDGSLYATAETTTAYDADGQQSWASEPPAPGGAFPAFADDRLVTVASNTVYGFALDETSTEPTTTERSTTDRSTTRTTRSSTEEAERAETTTAGDEPPSTADDGSTTPDDDETDSSGSPGFGMAAGVLGLGGFAEYVRRQQDEED
jgi:outer membrane protein assembly factor BamB